MELCCSMHACTLHVEEWGFYPNQHYPQKGTHAVVLETVFG